MQTNPVTRNVNEIVDRQVRAWELSRRATKDREREVQTRPVITISRQYGARGAALGRRLSSCTGYQLWDREIVHAIAAGTHESPQLVKSLDEHAQTVVEEFLGDFLGGHAQGQGFYTHRVFSLIRRIERKGGAILVGRGAEYIVSPEGAFRIRCVCDFEMRARSISERYDLDMVQARRRVQFTDRDRSRYIREQFGRSAGHALDYDLVINTGTVDLEAFVPGIMTAMEAKFV